MRNGETMKYENGQLIASVAELRAACEYASQDQSRMHLASVCFDVGKARVAATDGHRMIVLDAASETKHADRNEHLVNAQDLARALKGIGASKDRVRVSVDKGALSLETERAKHSVRTVDAQFPPIDQVIPPRDRDEVPAKKVGFNASYLEAIGVIAAIVKACDPKRAPGVWLSLGAELDPARIDCMLGDEGEVTIVIMPMRI